MDGQQHVPSAVGPMAPSLSSLTQVAKLMIEAQPWVTDPNVPPVPWRNDVFQELSTRKLVIGVMPDDGIVRPHPPIERLMARIVDKLRVAGHEIVEWDASLNAQCIQIMVRSIPALAASY